MNKEDNSIFEEYERLIKAFRDGDENAFSEIYEKSKRMVYTSCYGILNNEEDAEDAMQETYITAVNKLDTLDDDRSFVSWIKQIAARKSIDMSKKRRGNISYDDAIESDSSLEGDDNLEDLPDYYINEKVRRKVLERILREELSDVQYQTIHMYYYDELSVEKIAELMDCPAGTVKTRLKASRIKIKEGIKKYEKDNKDAFAGAAAVPFLTRFFNVQSDNLHIPAVPVPSNGEIKVAKNVVSKASKGALKNAVKENAYETTGEGFLSTTAGKAVTGILAVAVVIAGAIGISKIMSKETTNAVIETTVTPTNTPSPTPTPATINVFDYMDVVFTGMNREGEAEVYIDSDLPIDHLYYNTQTLSGGFGRDGEVDVVDIEDPLIVFGGNLSNDNEVTITITGEYDGLLIEPESMTYTVEGLSRYAAVNNSSDVTQYPMTKGLHYWGFYTPVVDIDGLDTDAINADIESHIALDYQGHAFRCYYYNIEDDSLSLLMCYTGPYYEIGTIDFETGEITWESDAAFPEWAPFVDVYDKYPSSVPYIRIADKDNDDIYVEIWDHRDVGDSYAYIMDYSYNIGEENVEVYLHYTRYTDDTYTETEDHYDIATVDISTGAVTWENDVEQAPDWA